MITIFIKATNTNNLRDLIRSMINNAENRENYQIYVGGDPAQDDKWLETISEFKERADIFLMKEGGAPEEISTELFWTITDEFFVLGHQWDKRINFYKDNFPDEIVVMLPSGYKPYGAKSEIEIATIAEKNPIVSAKWAELVGLNDVEMICRILFIKHTIDRRIDMRLLDLQPRGAVSYLPAYDAREIEKKADIIADYVRAFTPRGA